MRTPLFGTLLHPSWALPSRARQKDTSFQRFFRLCRPAVCGAAFFYRSSLCQPHSMPHVSPSSRRRVPPTSAAGVPARVPQHGCAHGRPTPGKAFMDQDLLALVAPRPLHACRRSAPRASLRPGATPARHTARRLARRRVRRLSCARRRPLGVRRWLSGRCRRPRDRTPSECTLRPPDPPSIVEHRRSAAAQSRPDNDTSIPHTQNLHPLCIDLGPWPNSAHKYTSTREFL